MTQFIHSPKYFQAAFVTSSGYPMGQQTSPDDVANGTTTSPQLLLNLAQFQEPEPTRDTIVEYGGSVVRLSSIIGVSDYGVGSFQLSSRNTLFESYFKGTTVDTSTVMGWTQSSENSNQIITPRMMIAFTTRNDDRDDTASPPTITSKYLTWVYLNAQIYKSAVAVQQGGGTNPNPLGYSFAISPSFRTLTGDLYSTTGMTVTGSNDVGYKIEHNYPLSFTTYKEAASPAGTFILGYRPRTNQATTSDKRLTKNGASASITTLSATTGVVTMTAGSAGDIFVLAYETEFVAI